MWAAWAAFAAVTIFIKFPPATAGPGHGHGHCHGDCQWPGHWARAAGSRAGQLNPGRVAARPGSPARARRLARAHHWHSNSKLRVAATVTVTVTGSPARQPEPPR